MIAWLKLERSVGRLQVQAISDIPVAMPVLVFYEPWMRLEATLYIPIVTGLVVGKVGH
jgi:hypothetical protein